MAKLRRELITPKSGGGGAGEGFDVAKTGYVDWETNTSPQAQLFLETLVLDLSASHRSGNQRCFVILLECTLKLLIMSSPPSPLCPGLFGIKVLVSFVYID